MNGYAARNDWRLRDAPTVESGSDREPYTLPDDALIDATNLARWLGKKRSWVVETANKRRRRRLQMPALKMGREWRFRVGDIRCWLAELANRAVA